MGGLNDFWQERNKRRHPQGRPRRPEPDRHSAAKTTPRPSLILTRFTRLLSQQVQSDYISKMPSPVKKPLLDSGAVLRFAKLSEHAMAPSKGSKLAAGYDLHSAYDYEIAAHGKVIAKTDLQIRVPDGTYGRIAPRSGLAAKHFIDIGAGVVDQDYTGNVGVVMFNHASDVFTIKKGDRIAQLVCEKISYPELEEVESLMETARGEGGFGSTGVAANKTGETDTAPSTA